MLIDRHGMRPGAAVALDGPWTSHEGACDVVRCQQGTRVGGKKLERLPVSVPR